MALVMGSAKKDRASFLGGGRRSPQGPQMPEAEVEGAAQSAEAAQGAEEAQDTGEAQGDSFPRKYSTKFFHRDGQPNTYIGSFRWKVFQTFENPAFSNLAKLISIVVMATILVSTLTFIFESEACEPTSFVPAKTLKAFLVIEIVSVTIFTMCAPGARVGLRAKAEAHSMWRAASWPNGRSKERACDATPHPASPP